MKLTQWIGICIIVGGLLPSYHPQLASLYIAAALIGLANMVFQVSIQNAVGRLGEREDREGDHRSPGQPLVHVSLLPGLRTRSAVSVRVSPDRHWTEPDRANLPATAPDREGPDGPLC